MPTETTLAPDDYHVYSKLPAEWCVENDIALIVAEQLRLKSGNVLRRVSHLVRLNLVERRTSERGQVITEIRRVGKI